MLRYTQYRHSIGLGLVQYPIEFWHLNSIGFRFSGTWTSILYTSYSFEFCRKKWTDQILLDFYLVAWNWPQWRWWRRCTVQVLQPVPLVMLLPTPLPCAKKDQHTLPHTEHRWYSSPRVSGRPRVGIDRPHEQQLCWREQQQMHRKPLSRNMLVHGLAEHADLLQDAAILSPWGWTGWDTQQPLWVVRVSVSMCHCERSYHRTTNACSSASVRLVLDWKLW